jgi:hypothetical protein
MGLGRLLIFLSQVTRPMVPSRPASPTNPWEYLHSPGQRSRETSNIACKRPRITVTNPSWLDVQKSNTSYTPAFASLQFGDGEWFWGLLVEDQAPAGIWSPISRFTKIWATPENKLGLLAPPEGQALAFLDSPSFFWTRVMGAAGYRIQIATDPGSFSDPMLSVDSHTSSLLSTSRSPGQWGLSLARATCGRSRSLGHPQQSSMLLGSLCNPICAWDGANPDQP